MAIKAQAKSLQENMAWNSIGSLIYLGCNWLTTVLVVTLSTDYADSGKFAVAMAVGSLTAAIVLFKVRPVQVSSLQSETVAGDFVGLRVVCTLFALIFTVVYCLISVAPENYLVVALYALFKVAESFVDVYHGLFQQQNRLDYAGKSQIIRGVLALVSFYIGLAVFNSLVLSIFLMFLSSVAAITIYDMPRARAFASVTPRFNQKAIGRLLKKCAAGFVSSLLITMIVSIARQSFGLSYGNEVLGRYAAVATPCVIVQAIAYYVYAPLYNSIGEMKSNHDGRALRKLVFTVTGVILGLMAACILLALLFGKAALSLLYGETIENYAYLLYGALLCTGGFAILSFMLDTLIIFGRDRLVFLFSVIPVLVCLGGTSFLTCDPNSISILVLVSYSSAILPLCVFFTKADC